MTVLIYRLGRIGDTMVALPALRLVQRAFPDHRRILLTEHPPDPLLSAPHLLAGSAIIDDVMEYDLEERRPSRLWALSRRIARCRAETLVYLTEPRSRLAVLRDWFFFRASGIRRMVGVPWSSDLRQPRRHRDGLCESEASRLARTIAPLGDARLDDPASWRLSLSAEEQAAARDTIDAWIGAQPFIAVDASAKPAIKEWGENRWRQLLTAISGRYPGWGALFCGGMTDLPRIERLAASWRGPVLHTCGSTPRAFHAWVHRARLFVGIDSGPMHLAAAAGVPVVAIAAAHAPPGLWYPNGAGHTVLRHDPPCAGCGLKLCPRDNACIAAVDVDSVIRTCLDRLSARS